MSVTSPQTNKSTGITHQIRLKLNFNDEKLWKSFSSRRLELIDSMRLSHKKASEQDEEILKCSRILMNEFNYSDEQYLQDFIKLVRVAIQSVRRNRKRSTKSKVTKGNNNSNNTGKFVMVKQVSTPFSEDDYTSENEDEKSNFKLADVLKTDDSSHYTYNSPEINSSRLPINSLLQPVLPRSKNSFTKLPSFASLLVDDEFTSQNQHEQRDPLLSRQLMFSNNGLIALDKLLSLIKKSRTCNDLSLDLQNSSNNSTISSSFYENLEVLGSTMILSTISYIFEKFFVNLNPSSISYLRLKLNNDFTLSKILKTLDLSLNNYYHNDFVSAQTFKRLIGCCVKDFGFDTVISPLTEIIHEIILKDYPLISKNSSISVSSPAMSSNIALTIPSPTASIITTSSLPRQRRYSDDLISVELKFNSNSLKFKFNPKTSSKPTFLELLENSKDAFNIHSKHVFLKNLKNSELIKNDEDIFKIFDHCPDGFLSIGVFVSDIDMTEQKRESPLDTLSSAAEVVESRSKENSISVDEKVPNTITEQKIMFQPLL